MQYLLTLLSQACCHQETYKTQYPNHLLSSPHSDIHLLAAAKYTDFFLFLLPSLLRSQSTTLGSPTLSPGREHSATHPLTSCSSNLQVLPVKPGTCEELLWACAALAPALPPNSCSTWSITFLQASFRMRVCTDFAEQPIDPSLIGKILPKSPSFSCIFSHLRVSHVFFFRG